MTAFCNLQFAICNPSIYLYPLAYVEWLSPVSAVAQIPSMQLRATKSNFLLGERGRVISGSLLYVHASRRQGQGRIEKCHIHGEKGNEDEISGLCDGQIWCPAQCLSIYIAKEGIYNAGSKPRMRLKKRKSQKVIIQITHNSSVVYIMIVGNRNPPFLTRF